MVNTLCSPWAAGIALPKTAFAAVREATIFECCKWDPQVGDVSVLLDTPLVLRADAWQELSTLAEALSRETIAAESELARRPDLHHRLGLPWRVRRVLRTAGARPAAAPFRVLRFDFHWTRHGWRITEVNSDVPGGFVEATGFTRHVAAHTPDALLTADPTEALAKAIVRHGPNEATVGLVHATAYTDDRQVMEFIRRALVSAGLQPILLSPADVRWTDCRASGHDGRNWRPLDLLFRFYPAEWLPSLGWRAPWPAFFRDSRTPLLNPGTALLTQSKRFPLVWGDLETPLPTWRQLLPLTCDPRHRTGSADEWVLKPALGRVGDGVDVAGATPPAERRRIQKSATSAPAGWAAQKRFDAEPWPTARGPLYPALGVYVIDGRAAGIYGRAGCRALVDAHAFDVAVLAAHNRSPFPS